MKLYKEASLMMLPTSVKDGKLYSIFPQPKPLSGELVTNGTFDTDSDWTKDSGWSIASGQAICNGVGINSLQQSGITTTGKFYKLTFDIISKSGDDFLVISTNFGDTYISGSSTSLGTNTFYINPTSGTGIRFRVADGITLTIDNVSVVEVDQLPADFDFSRGADRATRVTEQGLVRPVEIVGSELVNNGSFDTTLGSELVQNGDFEEIGSELVTNGDFSNGGNGWTPQAGNFEVIQGKAVVSHTNSTSFIVQSNVAQAGKIYRVEFTISDYSEGRIRLRKPFINGELENNPRNGTFVYYGEAIDQAFELQSRFAEDANYKVDNISVKEVGQNWIIESGDSQFNEQGLRVYSSDGSITQVAQTGVMTVGNIYKLTFDVISTNGANLTNPDGSNTYDTSTIGSKVFYIKAQFSTLYFKRVTGVTDVTLDNISVKEVQGLDDWILSNGCSYDGEGIRIQHTPEAGVLSTTYAPLTVGQMYRMIYEVTESNDGGIKLNSSDVNTLDSTVGVHTKNFIANQGTLSIARTDPAGTDITIDNISIVEVTEATDLPRLDWSGDCPVLLLEPQRTNKIEQSENFSDATVWNTNSGSVSLESGYLAPDGTYSAYKVTQGSNKAAAILFTGSGGILGTDARSIWARTVSGTGTVELCSHQLNTNNDFTVTEEWQRFEVNGTTSGAGATNFYAVDFRGAATDLTEVIIWGAQSEVGNYVTSYIPTRGQAATRAEDVCGATDISSVVGQSEGVIFIDFIWNGSDASSGDYTLMVYGDSNSNFVALNHNGSNNQMLVYNDGSAVASISGGSFVVGQQYKVALVYSENYFAYYINGVLKGTDTNGAVPSNLQSVRTETPFGAKTATQEVKQIAFFPKVLSDNECINLTTI